MASCHERMKMSADHNDNNVRDRGSTQNHHANFRHRLQTPSISLT